MISSDGRWVMAYNGEIYNHDEVRHRLEGAGVVFRGSSDTEVLVEAVQSWGSMGRWRPARNVRVALWTDGQRTPPCP